MSSVDTRVVEMKFNNNQFDQGVKSVLSSLRALKDGLKLDGATQGIKDISAATKGVDFSGMAAGVDNISSKFGVLGAIGFSMIQKLTQSVMGFASNTLSSILDPIITGGQARALTIEQAKFQFKGLGMDINATMASAKAAVLGTAYGLADAAKAASLLGASGMKAGPQMVSSLRAIAGVAAMTGSAYNDISDVFTSVAGNGRLMGSDLLRLSSRGVNAAATLAKSLGKTEADVRAMVTDGKISFKMFSDAMDGAFGKHAADANQTYTGSLANMKAALSRLGADIATPKFEAQRKVLNALSPVIDNIHAALMPAIKAFTEFENIGSANMVKMLKGLDLSGLSLSIPPIVNAIKNILAALKGMFAPIKNAFQEIFPPATAKTIVDMAKAFESFTQNLKMGETTANNVRRTFAGVFAVFDIGWTILKKIGQMFFNLFSSATKGSSGILDFTGGIGDFLVKIDKAIKSGDGLSTFFRNLTSILQIPIALIRSFGIVLKTAFDAIRGIDTGGFKALGKNLQDAFEPMTRLGSFIGNTWSKVGVALKKVWTFFEPLVSSMSEGFRKLSTGIANAFNSLDTGEKLGIAKTGILAAALIVFRNFFNQFAGLLTGQSKWTILTTLKFNISTLTTSLRVMTATLKAGALLMIAAAIGILALSMVAISNINPKKLGPAMAAITGLFIELATTMVVLEKTMGKGGAAKLMAVGISMIFFATAIDILASAVKKLAELDWQGLAKGLIGVTVLIGALTLAAKGMSEVQGLVKTGVGLILLAVAIKILVSAVNDLSGISWADMAKGLVGVGALLGALTLFTKFSEADKGGLAQGVGLLLLAVGIKILVSALKDMATMSWEEIGKGLATLSGALVAISLALKLIPPSSLLSAAAVLVVASSLGLIGTALASMGSMSWDVIGKGLVSLGGALVIIAGALMLLPPSSLLSAAAILIVASSLGLIVTALSSMGGMSWEEIAKGLVTLAGALGIIAIAMYAMTGAIPGALALLIVAGSLGILAPILLAFGNMSWEEIIKGLTMLAGVFLILGIAGLVLTPVVPTILLLGIAVALLGAGMLLAGVGLLLFSVGLTALSIAGAAGTIALVAMLSAMIGLIPELMTAIGLGVVAFANVIAMSGPAITGAITAVLLALITAIATLTPVIVSTLLSLIVQMLAAFANAVPSMISSGMRILLGFLQGIADNIGKVVNVASDIIVNFLNGIANNLPRIVTAGVNIITQFVKGIGDNIPKLLQSGADLILKFVNGLSTAIDNNAGPMGAAGGRLAVSLVRGLAKGITDGLNVIKDAAVNLASTAFEAAKKFLHINSPSKIFAGLGMGTAEGMAQGMNNFSYLVARSAEDMGHEAINTMRKSISGMSDIISGDIDMTPVIRPVLDLTSIQKDALGISSLLATNPISVDTAYSMAKDASSGYLANQDSLNKIGTLVDSTKTVSFIQNNNSPKALSPAEIYRLTKNQLSIVKGAL